MNAIQVINQYRRDPKSWAQTLIDRNRSGERVSPQALRLANKVAQMQGPMEYWMSTRWIADQLARMRASRPHAPQIPRYNPRPAGLIRPGCASEVVLAVLVYRAPVYLNFSQILQQSECTKAAVDFALRYLESQGHIEFTSDDSRNPRYRRYRATEKGKDYAASRV